MGVIPTKEERQLAFRAAQLIEKYGWVQGHSGGPNEGYCILGALKAVQEGTIGSVAWVCAHICDVVYDGGEVFSVVQWNEKRGRTKEDVIDLLVALSEAPEL